MKKLGAAVFQFYVNQLLNNAQNTIFIAICSALGSVLGLIGHGGYLLSFYPSHPEIAVVFNKIFEIIGYPSYVVGIISLITLFIQGIMRAVRALIEAFKNIFS